jgi:1-acyl-sn-glycerol-3-phosphate acyltransferase
VFYAIFRAFLTLCLHVMYRRIETPGLRSLPAEKGLLLVANHGNALIDPLLLLVLVPRPITFLAKHSLFPMPLVGFFVKRIGGLPVYRRHEAPGESKKNEQTLDECGRILARGGVVCLFPEGRSHDEPKLQSLRTGAARIYLRAAAEGAAPLIVPAGIHVEAKREFRSRVLVVVGRPIPAVDLLENERSEPGKLVRELTRRIEGSLQELTPGLDSWEELEFVRDVRALFVGGREASLSVEALSLKRFIQAYRFYRETEPEAVAEIRRKWKVYRRQLRRFSLAEEQVDLAAVPVRAARFTLLAAAVIVAVMPLALVGMITHYPAYRICGLLERRFNRHPDQAATVRLIVGIVLFPITYAALAVLLAWWRGWKGAVLGIGILPLCGWAALRVAEERQRLREGLGALSLVFTSRRRALESIRRQRGEILEGVAALLRERPPEAWALR